MCICIGAYDLTTKSKALFPSFEASIEYPG